MGRAMLIFVVLMTTIFASVLTSVYRNIGGVPDVLIRNQLNKEIENLSDFILKRAVREAASENFLEDLQSMTEGGGVEVGGSSGGVSTSDMVFTRIYGAGEEVYNNCKVDSIRYSFASSSQNYKIQTFISGEMQGVKVSRTAEMAFSYPIIVEGTVTPNIVYLEFDQVLRLNWLKEILRKIFGITKNDFPDSTSNNYSGSFHGLSFSSPTGNHDTDDISDWGDSNNKLFVKLNGHNTYITIDPDPVNKPNNFMAMDTTKEFSLLTFAKIDKHGRNKVDGFLGILDEYDDMRDRQGTLMWIPTDPRAPAGGRDDLRNRPAAAIWFETTEIGKPAGKLHFQVTQRKLKDGEEADANGNYSDSQYELIDLDAVMDYTRNAVVWNRVEERYLIFFRRWVYRFNEKHTDSAWGSYALTYGIEMVNGESRGVLRGYLNGGLSEQGGKVVTVMGEPLELYPNRYGMTLGARDIRNSNGNPVSDSDASRKHLFGIIDQAGMSDYILPEDEVGHWHNQVLKPTLMHYIRD